MSEKISNPNVFSVSETTVFNLQNDWREVLHRFSTAESKIEEIFANLVEKYSEKHRAYHNLGHINYLLEEVKKIELADFNTIFLATWFHDAIYEPKRSDNESESAKLAVKLLPQLNFPAEKTVKVEQIILATQAHSPENLDEDGKIFLDLDLSILGADAEIYQNYSQAIRREYSHVWNFLYRRGRKRILENFLRRETIYFTDNLRDRFEKQARLNLANEIKELS
jgi:predicted metal-dependent HD superfamily phosphohydrolase